MFALAMFAGGCGGDAESSSDSSSEARALTKAEFLKRGNALCDKALAAQASVINKAIAEGESQSSGASGEENAEAIVADDLLEVDRKMVQELSELALPTSDERAAEKIIEQFEADLEEAEGDPGKLFSGGAFKKAEAVAIDYGLRGCRV